MPTVPIPGGAIKASEVSWEEMGPGQGLRVKARRASLDLAQETAELWDARVELEGMELTARTARLFGRARHLLAEGFSLRRGGLTVTGETVELDLHDQRMEARRVRAVLDSLFGERCGRHGSGAASVPGAEVGGRGGDAPSAVR